ncbi:MAG: hypothetical protein ACRC9P_05125, partial [Bacteroides sp.]
KPIYPTSNVKFASKLNDIMDDVIGSKVAYNERDVEIKISTARFREVLNRHVFEGFGDVPEVLTDYFHMSWRELAEWLGTDILRAYNPDFFVEHAQAEIDEALEYGDIVMLTDVRFDNELVCATLGIGFKRDGDTRLEFNPSTPKPEKLGEAIAVWSNRYLVLRDLNMHVEAKKFLNKLKSLFEKVGLKYHCVYQTMLNADGELTFTDIEIAYNFNNYSLSDEAYARWESEL